MRAPLRILVPGGIFVLALGLQVLFTLPETWNTNRRAESSMRTHALVVGNIVASAVETAARRGGIGEASVPFEQIRGDRRLSEAVVVDDENRIVYASTLTLRGKALSASGLAWVGPLLERARASAAGQVEVAADGANVISAFPIRFAPRRDEFTSNRFGALIMRHSLKTEKAAALAAAVRRVGVFGSLLVVLCVLVWYFFERVLVRPVWALVDAAGRLGQGHRVSPLAGHAGATEIQRLSSAFDEMADALQRRTDALEESRAFLFATIDALPSHVAVLDDRGIIIAVNRAWRSFGDANGLALADHGIGARYFDFCDAASGEDREIGRAVGNAIQRIISGEWTEYQVDYPCPGPKLRYWFALEMRRFESNGTVRLLLAHQDITSIKQAERALRLGEERYRTLYDHNPSMFLTVKPDGKIASVNDFGAEQLGFLAAELIDTSVFGLYEEVDHEAIRQHLKTCLERPGDIHRWEASKRCKDGSAMWVRETARSIHTPGGELAVLIVCEDVSETQQLSQRLRYQASHDALTGLINRHEFEARLEAAVQGAMNGNAEHVLCFVDLDQFKVVNDTCGHVAGDELLRQVAEAVGRHIRARDTLARLGGDEFGILMEDCPLEQGVERAEAVRAVVEDCRFAWEGNVFSLGASIGVAKLDRECGTSVAALSAADAACYAAKDEGRNRVNVYQSEDLDQFRRHGEMRWVSRIQRALDDDLFELSYQRIAPLGNGVQESRLHYELLIRMRGDNGELISPGAFLPAAERFHLATRIDRWVVARATRWLAANPAHVERLELCTINLSGQSLAEDAFLDFVLGCIDAADVPADRLGFEITETAAIADLTRATVFMRCLSERGCRFALDDFGSGLSSFAYLKRLPVDILKIDGLFVRDIDSDPLDLAMVRSINEIGHVMGKQTVAEFVESEAIVRRLEAIGVDFIQGYAVDRPRPLSELERTAADNRPLRQV